MGELSAAAWAIRFLLGGTAVLASTVLAKKLGEKTGGICAAFPAVYLAALLTVQLDFGGEELIAHSIVRSKGAILSSN
ncbi:DUF3147 family protein [Bacillus sp. T33-2]|uniref:DUF3147 family protein n=1 Tax=Bacillus sp. T33-2 TaxID=2054168 RepID=UPI000C77B961|nr:DUF3147 family protein [Bacillus sp. T33-2]PLR96793.1 hypothetical protein CVD19_10505 [Bacillus sp. T33-2]